MAFDVKSELSAKGIAKVTLTGELDASVAPSSRLRSRKWRVAMRNAWF